MSKLSVIIPAGGGPNQPGEIFLQNTIDDILSKSTDDIEVIVVLDGYWPNPQLKDDKRVVIVHRGASKGMRAAINAAVAVSKGDFLLKTDAHCMFAEGFDSVLKEYHEDNWITIPSRYSLDAENWTIDNNGKPRRDYHYLCYPDPSKGHDGGMHGVEWWERGRQRLAPEYDIDETMSMQGSCWFMKKKWFTDFLGGMSEVGYGTFSQEPQEIGNKTWLGGGKLMTNKKTWYAHLHKGKKYGRMYSISHSEIVKAHNWSADFWMNNRWEGRKYDLEWLIDRFWPVPTWPEDWKEKSKELTWQT